MAACSAVIGIDFGSELIKIALVKPGTSFHIVVDEMTKRSIPSVVSFDSKERFFGNHALALAIKKSKRSFAFMHRLIGKSIDGPEVKQLKDHGFPWEFVALDDRKSIGVKFEDDVFTPEELTGMLFEYIKSISETDAEGPVKDCVISVPSFWTQNERQAIVDIAELSGLSVLSLINHNTAAALQYGIDFKYNVTDPIHRVAIYDMGTSSTEVSIIEYSAYMKTKK